jgi:hypothetical protein
LPWKRWTRNAGSKALAFIASLALWFSVTNEIEFEKTLHLPIEYVNLPDGITAVQQLPTEAEARIRARGKFLGYRLRGGVCRVDLSRNQVGMNNLVIDGANLVLPGDVSVVKRELIQPRQINVEFDELVVRDILIDAVVNGEPDSRNVRIGKTFVSPSVARVSGPRKLVDEIGLIHTEPIDIEGNRGNVRKKIRLEPPGPPTVVVRPGMVEVGITIEPRVSREIPGIALKVGNLPDSLEATFRPESLMIEVSGARSIVEVAIADGATLSIHADAWPMGAMVLEVKEFRGPEIVFEARAPQAAAPFPVLAAGDAPPGAADPASEARPAVPTGEIVARLPLPREVSILRVVPRRIELEVRTPVVPEPPGGPPTEGTAP